MLRVYFNNVYWYWISSAALTITLTVDAHLVIDHIANTECYSLLILNKFEVSAYSSMHLLQTYSKLSMKDKLLTSEINLIRLAKNNYAAQRVY